MKYAPYIASFGDQVPTCFDKVSNKSVYAITNIAYKHGVELCYHDVYDHMRRHSFSKPFSYSMTQGHILVAEINDPDHGIFEAWNESYEKQNAY
jgi:hypothetical protein